VNAPKDRLAPRARFTGGSRRLALAFSEAILPGSPGLKGADERTIDQIETYIERIGLGMTVPALGAMLEVLDKAAIAYMGRRFSRLSRGEQQACLDHFANNPATRIPVHLLGVMLKMLHFDRDDVLSQLGVERKRIMPQSPPSWFANVHSATSWDPSETIECDVVVIGTGAGGAVVGAELAERGHAVLFVEEGPYAQRHDFVHSQVEAFERFYRTGTWVFGNNVFPIFSGKLVGGSTAINTGTSLRPPAFVVDEWADRLGDDFSSAALEPYFAKVENKLGVTPNSREAIGPIADVIARGCDKLGWSHFAIPRNAPECQGDGFCTYGCPTEARRSTNVSYIPAALKNGATVLTGLRAETILIENGRAVGIRGVSTTDGRVIEVRARVVVLAGGAVPTPLLLLTQGIANGSREVGRNLTLHPSTGITGIFDEPIDAKRHIPQGYGSMEFIDDGILINAAGSDPTVFAITLATMGKKLMDAAAEQDRSVGLGVLVHDHGPGGRVRPGPMGRPLITYNLVQKDVEMLHAGLVRASQMLFAAGATKIYPGMMSRPLIDGPGDLSRLTDMTPRANDFMLISFHPLNTCRMGRDPRTSVVDLHQESHDVERLFIVDGSSIPGAPAVNPQITIMAFATRAAEHIHARLS
jgi:choline dehydrogenase-like flavoprotein